MTKLSLEPATRYMLADIVYQTEDPRDNWLAKALQTPGIKPLAQEYLNRAGLPRVPYVMLQAFANFVTTVLRRYRGAELAGALLNQFEGWAGKGLDPVHMQRMMVYCWDRLKGSCHRHEPGARTGGRNG